MAYVYTNSMNGFEYVLVRLYYSHNALHNVFMPAKIHGPELTWHIEQ